MEERPAAPDGDSLELAISLLQLNDAHLRLLKIQLGECVNPFDFHTLKIGIQGLEVCAWACRTLLERISRRRNQETASRACV
jgi:hypothetical protein